jgi:hypothetical protein
MPGPTGEVMRRLTVASNQMLAEELGGVIGAGRGGRMIFGDRQLTRHADDGDAGDVDEMAGIPEGGETEHFLGAQAIGQRD